MASVDGGRPTLEAVLSLVLQDTPFGPAHARDLLIVLRVMSENEADAFLSKLDRLCCLEELKTKKSTFVISSHPANPHTVTSAWGVFVVEKYLKALASEYAVQCLASSDTSQGTRLVALLIESEVFFSTFHDLVRDALPSSDFGEVHGAASAEVRSFLSALLFLLLVYDTTKSAALMVLPVFKALAEMRRSYAADLPSVLSYLLPGCSFQHTTVQDRLAMVYQQMHDRGYRFTIFAEKRELSPEALASVQKGSSGLTAYIAKREKTPDSVLSNEESDNDAVEDGPRHGAEVSRFLVLTPRDVLRLEASLTRLRVFLAKPDTPSLNAHLRVDDDMKPEQIPDHYIATLPVKTPRQLHSMLIQEGGEYRVLHRAEVKRRLARKASKVKQLDVSEVSTIMNVLHRVLRMQTPYMSKLQSDDLYDTMVKSEGWLPLSQVQRYVKAEVARMDRALPEDGDDIVEELLLSHDSMQRYEVGICHVKGSFFYGQRCARSVYAHDTRAVKLYKQIICRRPPITDLRVLPKYGWILVDRRALASKDSKRLVLPVYDNIPFVVVLPPEAIAFYRYYRENTPLERQYDEKIKGMKALYFVEVCLHALAKDTQHIRIYPNRHAAMVSRDGAAADQANEGPRTPDGGDEDQDSQIIHSRWYVFPSYVENRENSVVEPVSASGSRGFGLPKTFLSGRGVRLGIPAEGPAPQQTSQSTVTVANTVASRGELHCSSRPVATECLVDTREARRGTRREFALPSSFLGFLGGDTPDSGAAAGGREEGGERDWDAESAADDDVLEDAREEAATLAAGKDGTTTSALVPHVSVPLVSFDATAALRLHGCRWQKALRLGDAAAQAGDDAVVSTLSFPFPSIVPRVRELFETYLHQDPAEGDDGQSDGEAADDSAAGANERLATPNEVTWQATLPTVTVDVEYFKRSLDAFLASSEQYLLRWSAPKELLIGSFNVTPIHERSGLVREMKAYALSKGLTFRLQGNERESIALEANTTYGGCQAAHRRWTVDAEVNDQVEGATSVRDPGEQGTRDNLCPQGSQEEPFEGPTSAPPRQQAVLVSEVYEFLKPFLWSKAEILSAAAELGLSQEMRQHLPLLRAAFTRECENKTENYEMLEFIGDAVMDFVVALDGFLSCRLLQRSDTSVAPVRAGAEDDDDAVRIVSALSYEETLQLATEEALRRDRRGDRSSPNGLLSSPPPSHGLNGQSPSAFQQQKDEAALQVLASYCVCGQGASLETIRHHVQQALAFPLPLAPTTQITAWLCRNAVLAHLLPPTLDRHFDRIYGDALDPKVRADVFEAIVGAVYSSGQGLDRVRSLLRHLFAGLPLQLLAAALEGQRTATASPEAATAAAQRMDVLRKATEKCPYLFDPLCALGRGHVYATTYMIDLPLRNRFAPEDDSAREAALLAKAGLGPQNAALANSAHSSHDASTLFPRIQEKSYATHFTTGLGVYSYRRLSSIDTVRMFHRILNLFRLGGFAFTNEIVTETTNLVFDFDGSNIASYGVVDVFWNWYLRRLGFAHRSDSVTMRSWRARSHRRARGGVDATVVVAPAMMVLDCTGISVVKNTWKESCHVHFPQVTLRISDIAILRDDFLHYLFSQVEGARLSLHELSSRSGGGRVWRRVRMTSSFVRHELERNRRQPHRHLWSYCTFEDLLALSHTSKAYRMLVFEHVAAILESGNLWEIAALFGVEDASRVMCGVSPHAVAVVEDDDGALWVLAEEWVRVEAASETPCVTPSGPTKEEWGVIVDASLSASKKLRMYLCDKCDTIYGNESRPLFLDRILLPNGQLRVERPDKSFTSTGTLPLTRECLRVLKAIKAAAAARNPATAEVSLSTQIGATPMSPAPDETPSMFGFTGRRLFTTTHGDGDEAGQEEADESPDEERFTVCVAHASTLRLTSLRCPQYRDTRGLLYDNWDPVDVKALAAKTASSDATRSGAEACKAATYVRARPGARDVLPSYEAVLWAPAQKPLADLAPASPFDCTRLPCVSLQQPQCTTWTSFANACLLRPKGVPATPKASATSAGWWAFMPRTRCATFYVGGEPVFTVTDCGSLTEALADLGGMNALAHLLMPHIDFTSALFSPEFTSAYAKGIMPLFLTPVKKAPAVLTLPAAPSAPPVAPPLVTQTFQPSPPVTHTQPEPAPSASTQVPRAADAAPLAPPPAKPQPPPQQIPSKKTKCRLPAGAGILSPPSSSHAAWYALSQQVRVALPTTCGSPGPGQLALKHLIVQRLNPSQLTSTATQEAEVQAWGQLLEDTMRRHGSPVSPLLLFDAEERLVQARQWWPRHLHPLLRNAWWLSDFVATTTSKAALVAPNALQEAFTMVFLFTSAADPNEAKARTPLTADIPMTIVDSIVGGCQAKVFVLTEAAQSAMTAIG